MLKIGDDFVRYTPYGGVQTGRVSKIFETRAIDVLNKVEYRKDFIVTENGTHYCLDGSDGRIYKIHAKISEKRIELLNKIAERYGK